MKVSAIPQLYRNASRWTEILGVLSRYGLADWLSGFHVSFADRLLKGRRGQELTGLRREERVRLALTELGPTFIKLGQLLSTRADVVGNELADELGRLQADVPADPPEAVHALIAGELGESVEELYASFEDVPLASASIGQVHGATLRDGRSVVVKVRHGGIERVVAEDLDILAGLAQLAARAPELAPHRPVRLAAEFGRALRRELDFGREERNLQLFSARFADEERLRIPEPISELCTGRVLTMERLDGIRLTDPEAVAAAGIDRDAIARTGAELYLQMIFDHGVYHADPHPGNILVLPGNVIGLLDFGNVGRLDDALRDQVEELVVAVGRRDAEALAALVVKLGSPPDDLDEAALRSDVADLVATHAELPLSELDLTAALRDLTDLVRRHRVCLPPQVALLIKVLVTLEGTSRILSPTFSLLDVLEPFRRDAERRRLSPERQLRKLRMVARQVERMVETLPGRILEIADRLDSGRFRMSLDHEGVVPAVHRVATALLAGALGIAGALLLGLRAPPLLFREGGPFGLHEVSALGAAAVASAAWLGHRLLRVMRRGARR